MNLLRRQFLQMATAAAICPGAPRTLWAQGYPARPVRIIAGYPPGGVVDIYARVIGQWLSERLGQSFVVENRAGAAGTIAADSVARSPVDGYTLLLTNAADPYN